MGSVLPPSQICCVGAVPLHLPRPQICCVGAVLLHLPPPQICCACAVLLLVLVVQYMRRWKAAAAVSPAEREPVPALKDSTGWHIFCLGYADQEEEDDEEVVESGAAVVCTVCMAVPLTAFSRETGGVDFCQG